MQGLHGGVFSPKTGGECVETHLFISVEDFCKTNKILMLLDFLFHAKYFAYGSLRGVRRSPLLCAPGLVKFVPAVARLICLALPGSFLTMFAQNKGDLCTVHISSHKLSEIPDMSTVDSYELTYL